MGDSCDMWFYILTLYIHILDQLKLDSYLHPLGTLIIVSSYIFHFDSVFNVFLKILSYALSKG